MDAVLAGIAAVPLYLAVEIGDGEGLGQPQITVALEPPDDVVGGRVHVRPAGMVVELEFLAVRRHRRHHRFGRFLAAPTLVSGKAAAKSVMAAVAAHREEFEFDHHCGGPNLDATPNDIIRRIERYSGLKLAEAFAIPDLDREVKWHCKYARQNGIHVSPTFMIDGLVQTDMSSGDPVADWVARLLNQ